MQHRKLVIWQTTENSVLQKGGLRMTENIRGCFARSKAGHDKLALYVVVDFDDEYVWVSDGRLKPTDKPKKKKRKHVQLTGITAINIEEKIKANAKIADEDVRRAIKTKLNEERR